MAAPNDKNKMKIDYTVSVEGLAKLQQLQQEMTHMSDIMGQFQSGKYELPEISKAQAKLQKHIKETQIESIFPIDVIPKRRHLVEAETSIPPMQKDLVREPVPQQMELALGETPTSVKRKDLAIQTQAHAQIQTQAHTQAQTSAQKNAETQASYMPMQKDYTSVVRPEETETKKVIVMPPAPSPEQKEKDTRTDLYIQHLDYLIKILGQLSKGEVSQASLERAGKKVERMGTEMREDGMTLDSPLGKKFKQAGDMIGQLTGNIHPDEFQDLGKQTKAASMGVKEFAGKLGQGVVQFDQIFEGIARGNLPQLLGGIFGLGGLFGDKKKGGGGIGGTLAGTAAGEVEAGGGIGAVAQGIIGAIASNPLGAAAIAGLMLAGGAEAYGYAKGQQYFPQLVQSQTGILRSEDMLGGLDKALKTPFEQQRATKLAAEYGVSIPEVTGAIGAFMMAGGKAGVAPGITKEALDAQRVFGTSASVFEEAVGRMYRWVPGGKFDKAISEGFLDAQRYGYGGLARSGEWYQAQSQIVEMLGRRGGWQATTTADSSKNIMLTLARYGYGGEPAAQLVGQVTQNLPSMLFDPKKAATMMTLFGLTPQQMLFPGKPDKYGKTAFDQMLERAQTPLFRQQIGGEMGAGIVGAQLFGDSEFIKRLVAGEVKPAEMVEKLQDKSGKMAKDQVMEEQRAQNQLNIDYQTNSRQFLNEISAATKAAEAAILTSDMLSGHGTELLTRIAAATEKASNQKVEVTITNATSGGAKVETAVKRSNMR